MDLVVFSVVLILVIFAAFVLAIWAVVGEERRMQASWRAREPAPVASAPLASIEPVSPTPAVDTATATAAHSPGAAFVPAP